jgi:2',3'-cyclic-nucleotide 2'-phosphodiesterase (5'-nucleotidase family)
MNSLSDLHDGNGLSDAALPNGVDSNPIFDEIDYDLLTIGQSVIESFEHF